MGLPITVVPSALRAVFRALSLVSTFHLPVSPAPPFPPSSPSLVSLLPNFAAPTPVPSVTPVALVATGLTPNTAIPNARNHALPLSSSFYAPRDGFGFGLVAKESICPPMSSIECRRSGLITRIRTPNCPLENQKGYNRPMDATHLWAPTLLPHVAATHLWAPTLPPGYVPCSLWILGLAHDVF